MSVYLSLCTRKAHVIRVKPSMNLTHCYTNYTSRSSATNLPRLSKSRSIITKDMSISKLAH